MLDYCFFNMGIREGVDYPIMLTEPLCNPNKCRSITSELLFECYGVPEICYAVDLLCGFYQH